MWDTGIPKDIAGDVMGLYDVAVIDVDDDGKDRGEV
jgi:hypothetical protein